MDTYERTQPTDLDAERCVLGGMMLSRTDLAAATEIITGSDLYRPAHETIYDAIRMLDATGEPTSPVAVAAELLRIGHLDKIGGVAYLHTLVASVPTAANTAWYARHLAELARKRRLIEVGTRIAQLGYSPTTDASEAVNAAQQALHEATAGRTSATARRVGALLPAAAERIKTAEQTGKTAGLPTGIGKLDQLTGGLQPGELVLVAGRPGMGKSVLTVDWARHTAFRLGRPVALFSLEMSHDEIIDRIISAETSVAHEQIRDGRLAAGDWIKVNRMISEVADAPLIIDDAHDLDLATIRSRARRIAQQEGGLALVLVDYLQLMGGGKAETRQQEVSVISRELKLLAKELRCPVVAACQLNRGPEARADKRPQLSDLRESGSLEQDADIVILLHREDYYDKKATRRGIVDLIVAKNRRGPQDTIEAVAQLWYSRIVDPAGVR